jgi:hypothetical protein
MPASSKKQFRFFKMIENNPKRAKELGIKPSVGKEYTKPNVGQKSYSKLPESKSKFKRLKKSLKY